MAEVQVLGAPFMGDDHALADGRGKCHFQESLAVFIILENLFPSISSIDDVIDGAIEF